MSIFLYDIWFGGNQLVLPTQTGLPLGRLDGNPCDLAGLYDFEHALKGALRTGAGEHMPNAGSLQTWQLPAILAMHTLQHTTTGCW